MTDWAAEQKSIYEDFKSEGFALVVRIPGDSGEFVPEFDEYTSETDPQDISTYALKTEYESSQIDGTIVQVNDSLLKVPAYGLPELTPAHEILVGGKAQTVVHIKAVSPGNVPLLYNVQVRS